MKKIVFMTAIVSIVSFAGLCASANEPVPRLWNVYFDLFKDAKYTDLTHAFEPVQPVWPGFGNARFKPARAGKRIEGYVEAGQEFTYEKHGFVATALYEKSYQMCTKRKTFIVRCGCLRPWRLE